MGGFGINALTPYIQATMSCQHTIILLSTLMLIVRAAELVNPTEITSSGGTLTTTLTMGLTSHTVGTHTVNTRTINGAIPGPTLRLSPGDTLNLNFVNSMSSQATAVTTHDALGL